MNEYEWDYEWDLEEGGYSILYKGYPILSGLTEQQAIIIVQKHNLIVNLMEEIE